MSKKKQRRPSARSKPKEGAAPPPNGRRQGALRPQGTPRQQGTPHPQGAKQPGAAKRPAAIKRPAAKRQAARSSGARSRGASPPSFKAGRPRSPLEGRASQLCLQFLKELERSHPPCFQAIKRSLDNALYDPRKGYLTPKGKKVSSLLNVSSIQKITRAVFFLDILLGNLRSGAVNTKREIYYIAKGLIKGNLFYKPLDLEDQNVSDSAISFICDMFEVYREEMNCFANDRGGQTYSKNLIVTEILGAGGKKAVVDLSQLGTTPFQPKNRPQQFQLKAKGGKLDFCVVVESEGTANTLVANGMTERHRCVVMGAQGVPSAAVRGWCRTIQDQLDVPIYFYGDLDAYTLQNIYRTLKAGSAASLIRNRDFSAPKVRFLGLLPEDVEKHALDCYDVSEKDASEARSLKKARDALKNDPFFHDRKNKKLAKILKWLVKERRRCEQQSVFSTDPGNPRALENFIVQKIRGGSYI